MAPHCRHSPTQIFDGRRTVVGRLGGLHEAINWVVEAGLAAAGREDWLALLLKVAGHQGRPIDLTAAEMARAWGPVDLGLEDMVICSEMRERGMELASRWHRERDLPQLDAICEQADAFSCRLERFAAVALGIYKLRGWTREDRYTLSKWQLLLSAHDHGREIVIAYSDMPRDLFDTFSTPESLGSWLDHFSLVRDPTRV